MKSSPMKKHGGARRGAGKPAYKPTEADRTTVTVMAAIGLKQDQIADCLGTRGISRPTLEKYFAHELAIGLSKVSGLAGQGLVKAIQNGEAWAICFWMKTRMGWSERSDHRFVDIDGKDRNFNLADIDRIVAEADRRTQGGVLPAARLVQ